MHKGRYPQVIVTNVPIEHPFGTVKWHHGAHYLLCKGKEKATATAELGLSFLAYNLKRAINMVGVSAIIAAI